MDYLLKSSAIIFIFYLCYKLFLQRDTFFESNRWFLLFGLITASCIPLIVIPIYIEYTPIPLSEFTVTNTSGTINSIEEQSINYIQLITWIYFTGLAFFVGKLAIELLSLKKIIKTGNLQSYKNFKLIETTEQVAPFSFFNYIVFNPNQFNDVELEHVINHEKAHTQQLHSIDTIMAQIACVILWFNPFVWLYKKALQQNLEFIADQKAQHISPCEKSYQTVLLKASIKNHQLVLTNNFYTSLIKKRIIMLHKSKSKKLNQLKLIVVLPLIALFVMSFNTEEIYVESNADSEETTTDTETIEIIITKNTSDEELKSIKETLKSKGISFNYKDVKRNSEGDITSISTEFKSEKSSSNYNISGDEGIKSFRFESTDGNFRVGTIDNNTFVFKSKNGKAKIKSTKGSSKVIVIDEEDDNGSSTVDVKVLKSKDTVYFTKKKNTFAFSSGDEDSNIFIQESDEPLFIINGKKVEKSLFEDVDSDDIESVFILKGDNALKKYGKEGENGVIIMTKKGAKNLFSEDEDEVIIESESQLHINMDGKNSPLFIVDDEIVEEDEIQEINPNQIDRVEVIKDSESVKQYGNKGKDGVVKIFTKKNSGLNSTEDSILIVESSNSNSYTVHESHELMIDKTMSNAQLNQIKEQLKAIGIEAKFSKIKRNKAGEITSIKIALDDNNGSKSSASWKEKTKAIPNIVMGKQGNKLFINSI